MIESFHYRERRWGRPCAGKGIKIWERVCLGAALRQEGNLPPELEIKLRKASRKGYNFTRQVSGAARLLGRPSPVLRLEKKAQLKRQLVGKTAHLCKQGVAKQEPPTRESRTGNDGIHRSEYEPHSGLR